MYLSSRPENYHSNLLTKITIQQIFVSTPSNFFGAYPTLKFVYSSKMALQILPKMSRSLLTDELTNAQNIIELTK